MSGLDRETEARLAVLLDRIVPYFRPEAVYLFGSRAEGRAGPDSDYDLLVVVPDDTPQDRLAYSVGAAAARAAHVAADVIPIPRRQFERRKTQVGTLSYAAWHRGKLIHGRPDETAGRDVPPSQPGDESVTRDVVGEWLETVERDLRSARKCLDGDDPVPETAAFLCQQAAEKLVKAVMILHGIEPRKQHDIGDLIAALPAAAVARYRLAPLAELTEYAFAFRYADWRGPAVAVPAPADLAARIEEMARIRAMVAAANAAGTPSP